MQDFDEHTITDAVVRQFDGAVDARTGEISAALVRHLHAFIREVRPTEQEWTAGIAFLTATGQMCSDTRQEFILLSDSIGVSTLVDAINHPVSGNITETTVFGPFYVPAPTFPLGASIAGTLEGMPMHVSGTVRGPDGHGVPGASVDVWHSDEAGFYDVQQLDKTGGLAGRGRIETDAEGRFHFWTVRPAAYPIPHDGPVGRMLDAQGRHPFRPEHIHFMVQSPGHEKLVTHIFADEDRYLDSDVVFGVKKSLIRPYVLHPAGAAPDGTMMTSDWVSLACDLVLAPARCS